MIQTLDFGQLRWLVFRDDGMSVFLEILILEILGE